MMFENVSSKVFGGATAVLEGTLKNPNQYRDAILYENLSALPAAKLKEFVRSPEAKTMLNEGLISRDTIDRLAAECKNGCLNTTICHIAKENDDPLWDELVKLRVQERRLFNELVAKYGEQARPVADNANKKFVESCIPEYFRG